MEDRPVVKVVLVVSHFIRQINSTVVRNIKLPNCLLSVPEQSFLCLSILSTQSNRPSIWTLITVSSFFMASSSAIFTADKHRDGDEWEQYEYNKQWAKVCGPNCYPWEQD